MPIYITGVSTFTNSGTIDLQSNPVAGDVLVITGARQAGVAGPGTFISNGVMLKLDTVLNEGGAATRSDTLVVDGTRVGSGPTNMAIRNAGGAGALTVGNGILVVQVLDPSRSAPGAFALAPGAEVRAGAFDYDLPFHAVLGGLWGEINADITGQVTSTATLYANASYQSRFDGGGFAYTGKAGLRVNW
jgi:hypothetical protein